MIVAAARRALGARFRLHGRDPAGGFDCVGLVAWALGEAGLTVPGVPTGYGWREAAAARVAAAMARAGLRPVGAEAGAAPGDVLLFAQRRGQAHLGIASAAGVIHADAMLRRVVERPDRPWPVTGAWRG